MLRSAFSFCCSIGEAEKGMLVSGQGNWLQMRAMRGSMLLPILFLLQGLLSEI